MLGTLISALYQLDFADYLGLSKTTVNEILKRHKQQAVER